VTNASLLCAFLSSYAALSASRPQTEAGAGRNLTTIRLINNFGTKRWKKLMQDFGGEAGCDRFRQIES